MDNTEQHLALGKHLLSTSPGRAAQEFRAALAEAPDSPYAHVLLASALIGEANGVVDRSILPGDRRGELLREAERSADAALALDSEYVAAHLMRTRVLIQLDSLLAAGRSVQAAVKLDPENDYALSLLGYCRFQIGEYSRAETVVRRACELDPNDESHFLLLSRVLRKLGRREEAWNALQVAVKLNPASSSVHEALGTWHLDDGDFQAALPCLSEALRINPSNRSALQSMILAQAGSSLGQKFYWKWHIWHFSLAPHRQEAVGRMYGCFILLTFAMPLCCWAGPISDDNIINNPLLQVLFWIIVVPLGLVSTYLMSYNAILMKRYRRLSNEPKEKMKNVGWLLALIFCGGFILLMLVLPLIIK